VLASVVQGDAVNCNSGIDSLQRNFNSFKPMTLILVIADNEGTVLPGP